MTAVVIGNGLSRKPINLEKLRNLGVTYGCNALYRDYAPDYLIATDGPISAEIQECGYSAEHEFYTRYPYADKGAKKLRYPYSNWSSGPNAVQLAIDHGNTEIYLIGFDFGSNNGQFNNCYAGTKFYKDHDEPPTYSGNWFTQMEAIFRHNRSVKFTLVIGPETQCTQKISHFKNVERMDINEFLELINNV